MPREIWTSPVLGKNRARLISRCSDLISSGKSERFLYIAASQPLLNLVTDALLDGRKNRGVWGTLPVFLFRGFVHRVLETASEELTGLPLESRSPVDREESPMSRSLLSLLIRRLASEDKLTALAPLASREGSVNSIARLIGEIQRAARTPADFEAIVEARIRDQHGASIEPASVPLQRDYDRDLALIYRTYVQTLDRFHLTERDADQLRSLAVLRGELNGEPVRVPWIANIDLLVLDGFFDFTPVQGELLRLLIPRVPDVIVNLNLDSRNLPIFEPFRQTVEQLEGIAEFERIQADEADEVADGLFKLRPSLFNPGDSVVAEAAEAPGALETAMEAPAGAVTLFDCGDREAEIRRIAKEIKRLVCHERYSLADIALVVRERASYERLISRVLADEAIPCALERGGMLSDAPVVRAAVKLFEFMIELHRDETRLPRMSSLSSLIKSDYFEPRSEDVQTLLAKYQENYLDTLALGEPGARSRVESSGIGRWNADALENVIAYVGGELRINNWLDRARRLAARLVETPAQELTASEVAADSDAEPEEGEQIEQTGETGQQEGTAQSGRRRRPSRELDPAQVAWAALEIEYLSRLVGAVPRTGSPRELRDELMKLLERLQFARKAIANDSGGDDSELARAALELRGLEGIRRAMAAAVRAIEVAWLGGKALNGEDRPARVGLAMFLEEVIRAIRLPSLRVYTADPAGLRVLEATDVRGLRFRAVFIVGLIEGGFPLRAARDWLYPHEERERLRLYGLALEDISSETLLKEEHYFYQAACRATERLYLSWPRLLDDESETVPAYYIDELKHTLGPRRVATEEVRRDFDGQAVRDASTPSEVAVSLVRQDERSRHSSQRAAALDASTVRLLIDRARKEGFISESSMSKIGVERERAGQLAGRFDGVVFDPRLLELIQELYDQAHVYSASELSVYGRCPFQFFSNKLLKLEPRGEAALDLTALDAGTLLHKILNRFFAEHRRQSFAALARHEVAGLRNELQSIADRVFDEHEQLVPPLNPQVWRIDREIRKVVLDQLLLYEIGVQQKTSERDVRPAMFELAFGMRSEGGDPESTEAFLVRSRPGSADQISLRGQIDRVDLAADGTVLAYDYKLSKGATRADMEEGRDLQLHVYLSAIEQLFLPDHPIAGGGYYAIRRKDDRRNQGLYRELFRSYTALGDRVISSLDDGEWQRMRGEMEGRIWEFVDAIRHGRFEVRPTAPKKTCSWCNYSGMCRYDRLRKTARRRGDAKADETKIENR